MNGNPRLGAALSSTESGRDNTVRKQLDLSHPLELQYDGGPIFLRYPECVWID